MARRLFTSESVTEGHPDKMADQISDAILDAMIKDDTESRVAVETLITTGQVHVAGEVTTAPTSTSPASIREKILEIGYDSSAKGFDGASCGVSVSIGSQSPDIALGRRRRLRVPRGRGHRGLRPPGRGRPGPDVRLRLPRDAGADAAADPDRPPAGPAAVQGPPQRHRAVPAAGRQDPGDDRVRRRHRRPPGHRGRLLAARSGHQPQGAARAGHQGLRGGSRCVDALDLDTAGYRLLVNPTGRFEVGGPMGDAGLTGRKIIIDTYGGMARHGGGAFSGKDPSKVDRSAAYAMRWVAKNVVAAGLADRCEAQVAYAIGKAKPVGLFVESLRHREGPGREDPGRRARRSSTSARRRSSGPRPAAPDLLPDRRVRPLRPDRAGLLLGAHRPGGAAPPGRRPLIQHLLVTAGRPSGRPAVRFHPLFLLFRP